MNKLLTILLIGIMAITLTGCSQKEKNDFVIIDKSNELTDFVCASALEQFYEDEKFIYSFGCIKSDYVVVKYNNGNEETVKEALINKKIKIDHLDEYNIDYIKEEKINDKVISSVKVIIDGKEYKAKLENNETTQEFIRLLPQEFNMNELNGNEKYTYLDNKLRVNPVNPKKINAGDIMLYGNDCLVIFYKSFNTSYSYTKIGHIDNLQDLGSNNILVKVEK